VFALFSRFDSSLTPMTVISFYWMITSISQFQNMQFCANAQPFRRPEFFCFWALYVEYTPHNDLRRAEMSYEHFKRRMNTHLLRDHGAIKLADE